MEKQFINPMGLRLVALTGMLIRDLSTGPDHNSSFHPQSGFFPGKSPVTIFEDGNSKQDKTEEGQSKA